MPVTLYETSIPLLKNGMQAMAHMLTKSVAHTKEADLHVNELCGSRLVEDMLPLTFQIHAASDTAQKVVARVQGTEPKDWKAADIKTVEDMQARIAATLEILEGADAKLFDERADEVVTLGLGPGRNVELPAKSYIQAYGIPNFFFHVQTAYAILRMKGIPLGKTDFLGPFLGSYVNQ
jgi:uncharacterized protein